MLTLTLTPKLLMQIKTTGIRKNRIPPSIPLGTSQTATSPAIAVIIAANVMEYVNLKDVSHSAVLEICNALRCTNQYATPTVKAKSSSTKTRTNSTKAPGTGQIESISVMHCITPHANKVRIANDKNKARGPAVRNTVPLLT